MSEERYLRHGLIDWFSQEKLSEIKIAVVGAGAVGNEVIKNLALLGVGEIHVFDFDTIEVHNLTRSVLFRENDVGRPKAEVAACRAMELDPNIIIVPKIGNFWDRLSLTELQSFDVLFCCVDNFEARIRCNCLCFLTRVDFINIGIDSRYAGVELYPFSHSVNDGCLECNLPPSVYARMAERFSCGHLRKLSFIEKKIPTTIITSAIAASLAVSLGLRMGDANTSRCNDEKDKGDERSSTRFFIDTISGTLTRASLAKNDACPCCGQLSDVRGLFQTTREISCGTIDFPDEVTVTTSEPILVSYTDTRNGEYNIVFRRASEFDSNYPTTISDDPEAVELEIRDQFTLKELLTCFSGYLMPCKYAILANGTSKVLWEFEGDPV